MELIKKILRILLLVYLGFGLLIFIFQNRFIYYPDKQDFNSCPEFSSSEKLNLNDTRAYYKNNSEKLIVFYHGNAGSACDRGFLKDEFERLGYSYMFIEYSGYSNDSHRPSKERLMADVSNVNDFLKGLNYQKLVLAGESLGTSLAMYHSSLAKEDKLLLIAPFYSLEDVAKSHYPVYPISLMLRDKYDSSLWATDLNQAEIIQGSKDSIIPISQGKKLFESLNTDKKEFVEIPGANHNNIYYFPETFEAVNNFLK